MTIHSQARAWTWNSIPRTGGTAPKIQSLNYSYLGLPPIFCELDKKSAQASKPHKFTLKLQQHWAIRSLPDEVSRPVLSLLPLPTITPGTHLLAGAGAQTEPWQIEMQFPGLTTNAHMIDDDGKRFPSKIPPNYASQRKICKTQTRPKQPTTDRKTQSISPPQKLQPVKTPTRSPPNTLQKLGRRVAWGGRWWNELRDGYGYGCGMCTSGRCEIANAKWVL